MAVVEPTAGARGRRGEAAERQILDSAARLLRTVGYHALTVEAVMAATSLSRPAFYQYFRDIHDLILRLLSEAGEHVMVGTRVWLDGDGDPEADLREALRWAVNLYAVDGTIVAGIHDAARRDPAIRAAYRALADEYIRGSADRIRREAARGRCIDGIDPEQVAAVLVLANGEYIEDRLTRDPQVDPEELVHTLLTVWMRTIFGTTPARAR